MKLYLSTLFSMLLLFGCSEHEGDSANQADGVVEHKDSVKILSASPDHTVTLKVGSRVTMRYEVQYNLESAETGSLTMVIQTASNETLGNEFYVVDKGSGTQFMEAEIVVPDTRAVQVFTPLNPQGNSRTTIVESRLYRVEQ